MRPPIQCDPTRFHELVHQPALTLALTVAITLALSSVAGIASAQLQWQSSGVQQASHTANANVNNQPVVTQAALQQAVHQPANQLANQAASQSSSKLRAKAPKVLASGNIMPTVSNPTSNNSASRYGTQVLQQAAYAVPNPGNFQRDSAVQPACHCGSCSGGNFSGGSCGMGEASCGFEPGCGIEASCGFPEPSCGVMTDPTGCGCGNIGCAGECGATCGCGDVCSCGQRGLGLGCDDRGAIPLVLYVPPIQELTFFGGVQAFKSALDEGRDRGNFGIHEGVNIGGRMSWLPFTNLGYQIGYQATHSQMHGDATTNSSDAHTQQFATAGLFHRKPVGLQYGLVYDVLRDERQVNADFSQLRGLISITNPRGHEFGFTFASHLNETYININAVDTKFHAVDQYLLFYRKHGRDGGEFRMFGGLDNDGVGILGGDIDLPLTSRWSLQTGFTYLIPEDDANGIGGTEEAWNLGTNLVWHWGKRAKRSYKGQYRPMFNVADNGTLIVDDRP